MYRNLSVAAALTMALTVAPSAPATSMAPGEGCAAVYAAMPTCKFTVSSNTEQQGGAVGTGDWSVLIKRGGKTILLSSSGYYGEPSEEEFMFKKGDKVTVKAMSAGAVVIAGTVI